ncbi:MAG: hypothetical protein B7Y11_06275 [Sphingobacteriia bacterium 24-36-13]|jgi:hypothetical protein|uniref:DUF3471 domain-containing protein n=1 Tax=Sediminibacterium sp. TaxID=1917865 RepID=UPI000BCBC245|nr:DUF3471 domain-containing protein [Sediminibacterium sp.]OYY10929.1 MAG: hypothetical protein B7Y66_04450 [Sphingobacteriia bacterium 35-36-14]OYZ54213.1 MAG: hypothetical protein B7Y11_06275 [Sphingobacteriia bacterium 24-36-13]OZA65636.1 MAG: hypothetical protein B7X68_03080 [Sphingobacteriia bacterium 39-36-14]MBT9484633.1 hypothetical protein [Sediminibacterium sp.]HQS23711.1 hypothetical protein [Sediminibacterium sp.]
MKKILLFAFMLVGFVSASNAQSAPTDTTVNQLVGKYKFAEGSPVAEVTVVLENGVLMMNSQAGSSTLEKSAEDVYVITQFQGTAKFTRDENKKVTGVTILAMGYELVGTKEPVSTVAFSTKKAVLLTPVVK